jgi:UDP-N-acetylmuramoyl-L-alanyl-D-glutamate--2,6-diaminopimelate ligase
LAKQILFKELPLLQQNKSFTAVINIDDEYGKRIEGADGVRRWTYGQNSADFKFKIQSSALNEIVFEIESPRGRGVCELPLPGEHNAYNAVAAIAASMVAGVSLETAILALSKFGGVPGRLQSIKNNLGLHIFVDYAHTDHALEMVLKGLRSIHASGPQRIWTVFGCGGNRDQGKRPLMMKAAKENSDFVVLTSDNPRNEDPIKIIQDSLVVVSSKELNHTIWVEPDRKKAIRLAIRMAKKGDVLLIAGKGHEDYQIIGDQKTDFSDVKVIEEYLRDFQCQD